MGKQRHNFREMKIWSAAMNIVKELYLLTPDLPTDERFGLISQTQRCAVSIPSNIAEGSGRTTDKEFDYFLNVSLSSSFELETQLILINEIYKLETKELIESINELQKMILGFKRNLKV
jgi:four helix bundle protein